MSQFRHSLLPVAARLVVPMQYGFALWLLARGHNLPGGGFIAGLIFASALVLRVMVAEGGRAPRWDPVFLTGVGLLVALTAATLPLLLTGQAFFTGLWAGQIWLPGVGMLKLGSPLLFDIGVFLVVTGAASKMLLVLLAQHRQGATNLAAVTAVAAAAAAPPAPIPISSENKPHT